ncbi:MAG: hypothetical protein MZW92_26020 [Comamonadaceae bacterium]|nr:hypothetical protein [Comamonadaceae bacterium]
MNNFENGESFGFQTRHDGYGFQPPQDSTAVTRYQHIPQHLADTMGQPATPAGQPLTRVCEDTLRITSGDAEATSGGIARHTVSFAGTPGGSVVGTLQRMGPALTVELVPGDPTSRTDVRVALREGLLTRNAAGQLEDAHDQRQRVAEWSESVAQPTPHPEDSSADIFSPQAEQRFAQEIEPLQQHAFDGAQARAMSFVAHGVGSLESMMADRLARDAGMDPAKAGETIQSGIALYQQAADRALSKVGLTGDTLQAFYADARERPGHLQDAIQKLVLQRDPSGFTRMARDWQAKSERLAANAPKKG